MKKEQQKKKRVEIEFFRNPTKETGVHGAAVVRLNNNVVNNLGGRGSWVCINRLEGDPSKKVNKKPVYRVILGCGSPALFGTEIELDYDTELDLGIRDNPTREYKRTEDLKEEARENVRVVDPGKPAFKECKLEVKRLPWWKSHLFIWNHPDPNFRLPMRIALVLGLAGIFLGVVGTAASLTSLIIGSG